MVESTDNFFAQSFKHLTFNPLVKFNRADTSNSNENDGVASNGKMIAVNWKTTAAVAVFDATKPRNFDANVPLLKGHSGMIYDLAWSPFEDRLLATCADDGKAKLWCFDDYSGLSESGTRSDPDLELDAHARKCLSVQWHEAAENLLATHSIDKTVKIWDIDEARCDEPLITFTDMPDYATSIRWSPDGAKICGMLKNKSMVVMDPRQEASVMKAASHVGPRLQRVQWADDTTLITSGFDKEAKRQWGCWDLRNLEQPLALGPLSEGSGGPYIYYDRSYGIMIMAGRGDNVIGIYHFDKASPTFLNYCSTYNFMQTTQKAFCMAPKQSVDVSVQEVMRSVRITNSNTIEVLQMKIPSKVGGFNQEYYPEFNASEPSSTAEAWEQGTDVPAKTMQMS